ncbi:MAG: hypothetical protein UX04_C0002G0146 [Microgenomates group bacterium GW2011_GWF2_45_18]|nr:MAG: hypothetical protein UW18_C0005G0027 [Microgenomates group bacterium GW2011_GWF1_44_10]KKU02003.1 MAG: hypothetical protein UX04_C0002G0146 [Microgenomates group bacterium GW2011_GWF2_45_18]OGJ41189.1 MAG: hypothetical protein A2378_00900 [Candidatus Pacebacteria bacterium RIFOXYB1_FULL_44_10]HAU99011.1 hypothetical protein [Candidatus Paceibacterota bacterium]HAX01275.1 hypothetical protein [Candidatus Paceibacterota bacterium]
MSKKERGISPAEIEKKPERLPVKATFSFFDAPLSAKTIIHKLPLEKPLTRRDIEDIVIEITGRGQQEVQESKIVNFIQNVLGFYAYRTQKDLHFYLHLHTIPDQMVTVLHKKNHGDQLLIPRSVFAHPSGSPHATIIKNPEEWNILYTYFESSVL